MKYLDGVKKKKKKGGETEGNIFIISDYLHNGLPPYKASLKHKLYHIKTLII